MAILDQTGAEDDNEYSLEFAVQFFEQRDSYSRLFLLLGGYNAFMATRFEIHPDNPQQRLIAQAVYRLRKGALAIYPTDSCYAFGCVLDHPHAVRDIARIRQTDKDHNFTLLCRDLSEISTYARVENWSYRLLKAHTPGPFTFILPATRGGNLYVEVALTGPRSLMRGADVTIDLVGPAGLKLSKNGRKAKFENLPPGQYKVSAGANSFPHVRASGEIRERAPGEIDDTCVLLLLEAQ